jgi:hypothetical protein
MKDEGGRMNQTSDPTHPSSFILQPFISVVLDDPHPDGSTGMEEAVLALTYDPKVRDHCLPHGAGRVCAGNRGATGQFRNRRTAITSAPKWPMSRVSMFSARAWIASWSRPV